MDCCSNWGNKYFFLLLLWSLVVAASFYILPVFLRSVLACLGLVYTSVAILVKRKMNFSLLIG